MTRATLPPDALASQARTYASRGVAVFPLWWPEGDHACACSAGPTCGSPGKHPRVGRGGVNQASCDPATVAAWWDRWPDANIGLPAGGNRLAVIDVDPGHGGDDTLGMLLDYCAARGVDLMATRLVRTGSGGLHLYFHDRLGEVKTASNTFGAPGVDTRGRGGYVVAPPSVHVSGHRYELMNSDHRVALWPGVLTPLLDAPRHTAPSVHPPARPASTAGHAPRGAGWAQAGLRAECAELASLTATGSGRNNRLNSAAYKLGRRVGAGLLDEAGVIAALLDATAGWLGTGHTPRSIEATIRSGLGAGKQRPHTGPAPRGNA